MSYDSTADTQKHCHEVRRRLQRVIDDLTKRAWKHDASKLEEPEKPIFDEFTLKLRETPYDTHDDSPYQKCLREMGVALEHHYAVNDHHPEHFPPTPAHETDIQLEIGHHPSGEQYVVATATCSECDWTETGDESDVRDAAGQHERDTFVPSGVHAMNLMQVIEMLADWAAAVMRHENGDLRRSIEANAERFGYGEEFERLLLNTAESLGWI